MIQDKKLIFPAGVSRLGGARLLPAPHQKGILPDEEIHPALQEMCYKTKLTP